jgi:hypothetical protein
MPRRLICVALLVMTATAATQTADGWKLVWADEFDREGAPTRRAGPTKPASYAIRSFNGTARKTRGASTAC